MTVKELRQLLDTLPDDMPIYKYSYNMETGNTIDRAYSPELKTLYPSTTFGVDAFDGTPYNKKTFTTITSDEEAKKQGFQALLFY